MLKDIDDRQMPLLDHLVELRNRLIYSFAAIFAGFLVCYLFSEQIYAFLVRPLAELTAGDAGRLLAELEERLASSAAADLYALADELAAAGPELAEAAAADAATPPPELLDHPTAFAEDRRQHTPSALEDAAARLGFRSVALRALHPHPLPPAVEPLAPRFYNRLALAWQRPLETSPLALAFCTAFVAVFEKG